MLIACSLSKKISYLCHSKKSGEFESSFYISTWCLRSSRDWCVVSVSGDFAFVLGYIPFKIVGFLLKAYAFIWPSVLACITYHV